MGSATSLIRESPGTLPAHLNTLAPILELPADNHGEQLELDGTHINNTNNSSGGSLVRLADCQNHAVIGDHERGETTEIVRHQQQQQPGRLWLPAPITSSMTKRPKVRIVDPHSRSPFLPSSPKLHLHRYSPLVPLPRRATREGANNILEMSARNNTTNQWDPMPATPATASFGDECALQHDAFGEEGEDVQV